MSGTVNPSLVSSELTTIETFKDTTEKRASKLTLNELNYISDKQLHQKTEGSGSGEDLFPEFPVIIEFDPRNSTSDADIDNVHVRYLKGGYSEIRECPTDGVYFIVLEKTWLPNEILPETETIAISDENGVLFYNVTTNLNMLFNPDGTITFEVSHSDQNQ